MNKWMNLMCICMLGLLLQNCQTTQENTLVYLVRHAEKNLKDSTDNPALTAEGEVRAQNLMKLLQSESIAEIYTTKFQRNIQTVTPLATSKKIALKRYEWDLWEPMLNKILASKNSTYLICGHSNNLLPMIAYLGVKSTLPSIDDHEYGNLFKVQFNDDSTWMEVIRF